MADEQVAAPEGEVKSVPTSVVLDYANEAAKKAGISPDLARGIILAENSGGKGGLPQVLRTDRTSPKGATGIGQIMPDTYAALKAQGLLPGDHSMDNWRGQVDATIATIKSMQKQHRTNDPTIIGAAYNGGNAAARNAMAGKFDALHPETIDYLEKLRKFGVIRDANRAGPAGPTATETTLPDAAPAEAPTPVSTTNDMGIPDPSGVRDSRPPSVDVVSISGGARVLDPNAPKSVTDRGIEALMQLMRDNSTILNNLVSDITGSVEAAQAAHATAATEVAAAGNATGEAARIKGAIEAAGATTRARILDVANMNTGKADNLFGSAMAERFMLRATREKMRPEIDERMAVGLFDNPLQWLVNQTILPGKINQYNAVAAAERDNIAMVDSMQRQVSVQESIDLGATADLYARQALAVSNASTAEANAKAAEIKAASSAMAAQRTINVANLRERQVSMVESALKWQQLMIEKGDKQQLKADELVERAEINRRLGIVGDMIGVSNVSIDTLKPLGKDAQEMWRNRQGTLTLGDSLGESSEFIRRFGDLNKMRTSGAGEFADMQKAFQTAIDQKANDIRNNWGTVHAGSPLASKPPKDTDARLQAAAELQLNWEGQRDNNMLTSDKINPYRINHTKQALEFKGDKSNPIYQMVKDSFDRNQQVTDKILIDATLKLITSNALQPKDAASALSEYYSYAITQNNLGRSLKAIGLEEQTNYKLKPDPKLRAFDATNFVQTENFLTSYAAKKRAEAIGFYQFDPENYEIIPYPNPAAGGMLRRKEQPANPSEEMAKRAKERQKPAAVKERE